MAQDSTDWKLVKERTDNLCKEVYELKAQVNTVCIDLQDVKLARVEDRQKIMFLYDAIAEIKECMKSIKDSIDKNASEPDTFKEEIYKIGMDIFKYAMIGGTAYYFINKGGM